jgi:hypothetical protein
MKHCAPIRLAGIVLNKPKNDTAGFARVPTPGPRIWLSSLRWSALRELKCSSPQLHNVYKIWPSVHCSTTISPFRLHPVWNFALSSVPSDSKSCHLPISLRGLAAVTARIRLFTSSVQLDASGNPLAQMSQLPSLKLNDGNEIPLVGLPKLPCYGGGLATSSC